MQGKYRRIVVEKSDGSQIPEEEPLFVLRAQDILAPIAVRFYADLVQGATGNPQQSDQIRDFAEIMACWESRKLPD